MNDTQTFPKNRVPEPRPYAADNGRVTPAAEWRQMCEKLVALGYGVGITEVTRALFELEERRDGLNTANRRWETARRMLERDVIDVIEAEAAKRS